MEVGGKFGSVACLLLFSEGGTKCSLLSIVASVTFPFPSLTLIISSCGSLTFLNASSDTVYSSLWTWKGSVFEEFF